MRLMLPMNAEQYRHAKYHIVGRSGWTTPLPENLKDLLAQEAVVVSVPVMRT